MTRYIDVEEVKNFFDEMDAGSRERDVMLLTANEFLEYLDKIPTADVQEVRHGKWILRGGWFRCSECDSRALMKKCGWEQVGSDFCPYCGAKMDFEE